MFLNVNQNDSLIMVLVIPRTQVLAASAHLCWVLDQAVEKEKKTGSRYYSHQLLKKRMSVLPAIIIPMMLERLTRGSVIKGILSHYLD